MPVEGRWCPQGELSQRYTLGEPPASWITYPVRRGCGGMRDRVGGPDVFPGGAPGDHWEDEGRWPSRSLVHIHSCILKLYLHYCPVVASDYAVTAEPIWSISSSCARSISIPGYTGCLPSPQQWPVHTVVSELFKNFLNRGEQPQVYF